MICPTVQKNSREEVSKVFFYKKSGWVNGFGYLWPRHQPTTPGMRWPDSLRIELSVLRNAVLLFLLAMAYVQ